MVWNYRKRVKIAPGAHLNFSKNGVSTSIGPKGAKVTFGNNGTYMSTSIPGTGLYSRQKISGKSTSSNTQGGNNADQKGCVGCFFVSVSIALIVLGGVCVNTGNPLAIISGLIIIAIGIIFCYESVIAVDYKTSLTETHLQDANYAYSDEGNQPTITSQDTHTEGASFYEQTKFLGIFDPILEDAALLLIQSGTGATSTIQRKFSIGYNRAARIMEQLEKIGVVGPPRGSAPRELLVRDRAEWLILKSHLLMKLVKQETNKDLTISEETITSTSNSLTEAQFNLIKSASENLCAFVTKVGRKRNVRAKIDEMLPLEDKDCTPWPVTQKVQMAIFADLSRCYNGLGHNFSLDDDEENIGIYLFICKYLNPDVAITFDNVSQCKSFLKDSLTDVLSTSD